MRKQAAPSGANWFTDLSDFQVEAIEGLNFAIRDDDAEATVYRTMFCLRKLGVTPMPKTNMLRKLICACRRSDLAFLYFLLEACYKGASFQYSERILMSAITYLDLEMTLRELDRILPPGVERLSAREANLAKAPLSRRSTYIPPAPADSTKPRSVRSPYFMPLPKPKLPRSSVSNFACRPARHVVTFPFWPAGGRPNYRVNDENRWFANYKFQPVRRMLYEVVGGIMTDYWAQVGGPEIDEAAPLCTFHKKARGQEQELKNEAIVNAHKLCLALVDSTTREDEDLRKRIVAQLDKDIEDCTLRWQRLRQRHLTEVLLLQDHDQMCAMGKVPTASKTDKLKFLFHEEDVGRLSAAPSLGVHVITGESNVSQLVTVRLSDPADDIPCPTEPGERKLAQCPPQPMGHVKPPRRVTVTPKTIFGERLPVCKKPGRFFKGAQRNCPYVFHNHEIPPREQNPAPRDVMRRQAIRSLRHSTDRYSSSEVSYNERMQPREQVVAAIVKCAKDMWFGSLEAYQRSQVIDNPDLNKSCQPKDDLAWTKDIEFFDPDDRQLMDRLLKDAFTMLRRNPRCVYAAFPNSHKSDVMLEWIKRRYGKTYSSKEIALMVKQSLPIFRSVELQLIATPNVRAKGLSTRHDTFADVKRVMKLAEQIKADYRGPLNDNILRLTQICWKAMRPHLFTGSSVLQSFFAYLPVRYADMLR